VGRLDTYYHRLDIGVVGDIHVPVHGGVGAGCLGLDADYHRFYLRVVGDIHVPVPGGVAVRIERLLSLGTYQNGRGG